MQVDEAIEQQEKVDPCQACLDGEEEQPVEEDPYEGGHNKEQKAEAVLGKEDNHVDEAG